MRYVDFASTHAGHAYAEYEQYAVADADRERRDLLEHLLAGKLPTRGPLLAAAQGYGLGRTRACSWRPPCRPARSPTPTCRTRRARRSPAAALRELRTLVVVRQSAIVAVAALCADGDARAQCRRLEALQRRLLDEGMPLALGVSTVAAGVTELPRAPTRRPAARSSASSATAAGSSRCRGCRRSATWRCASTTPRGGWSTRACASSSRRTARAAAC